MHIVYKTTNTLNGKYYIGKHSCQSRCTTPCTYLGSGTLFKRALKKHGKKHFQRETLATFKTAIEAYEYEKGVINIEDPMNYNICGGGIGAGTGTSHPQYGMTHSDETKLQMSISSSGENNHNYGKTLGKKYRAKIAETLKGTPCKEDVKSKISEALKGKHRPPAVKVAIDGIHYPSMKSAARAIGVSPRTIKKRILRGLYETVTPT